MPLGIPGNGKSYFVNQIKNKFLDYDNIVYVVSSDELNWFLME